MNPNKNDQENPNQSNDSEASFSGARERDLEWQRRKELSHIRLDTMEFYEESEALIAKDVKRLNTIIRKGLIKARIVTVEDLYNEVKPLVTLPGQQPLQIRGLDSKNWQRVYVKLSEIPELESHKFIDDFRSFLIENDYMKEH